MEGRSSTFSTTILAAIAFAFNQASALGQATAGSALSFDGVDDLVIVPNRSLLELTYGTLELWFKPDWAPGSIAYDPVLVANQQGAALTRYSLRVDRNLAGVALANGSSVSTVAHAFTRGEWVHLALVESGPTAQVYVNGQLIGNTSNGFGTIIGLPLHQHFLRDVGWPGPRRDVSFPRRGLEQSRCGVWAGPDLHGADAVRCRRSQW